MRAVIIHDATGRIWSTSYGDTELPSGLKAILADIPDDVQSVDGIDMATGKPIFTMIPKASMDHYDEIASKLIAEVRNVTDSFASVAMVFGENLTDEQALRVPQIYPEWNGVGMGYVTGERVQYKGVLYRVLQNHTSQENWPPTHASSLYARVLISGNTEGIPMWEQPDSTNGYSKGDRVTHNGKTWSSLVDSNVWEPGAIGTDSVWVEVKDAE